MGIVSLGLVSSRFWRRSLSGKTCRRVGSWGSICLVWAVRVICRWLPLVPSKRTHFSHRGCFLPYLEKSFFGGLTKEAWGRTDSQWFWRRKYGNVSPNCRGWIFRWSRWICHFCRCFSTSSRLSCIKRYGLWDGFVPLVFYDVSPRS